MLEYFVDFISIPQLCHVISTREGGVSAGDYATLNLGYHVKDNPAAVTENRRRLGKLAGYNAAAMVAAQQVHGTAVSWVNAANRGRGAFSWDGAMPETDGLIVSEADIPVAVQVADCAPVLIVDSRSHVLAAVHAGWRGALGGIASIAVREMVAAGSVPSDLMVGIGPTLCPDCLEVGDEVATAVREKYGSAPVACGFAKPHLDMTALIAVDLATVGVEQRQIISHPDCTRCRGEKYFSHRGQHGQAGRFTLVAWWSA